ncbi:hypothetical protein ZIOFF_026298 [Zingiber officinale]|uniref:Uncharacterized protein n=1 Tax=Zingiber officinale TaxID=94328 RepID=A0A8J5H4Q0_ZINOF|nr:hypothetical protein ZIOFF_026298 [Zingiber officinale]
MVSPLLSNLPLLGLRGRLRRRPAPLLDSLGPPKPWIGSGLAVARASSFCSPSSVGLAVANRRLPLQLKKKPKIMQQHLDYCFPGLWLSKITPRSYKANE